MSNTRAPRPKLFRDIYRKLRAVELMAKPLAVFDQTFRADGFLRQAGWFESYWRRMPIAFGQPIPFYTYSSIAFLKPRVDKTLRVFEYGCGYSTLWWASNAKSVVACEHDRDWLERMKAMAPDNVELLYEELQPGGSYSKRAADFVSDIIVIDGRDRVNCAKSCLTGLSDRGVLIWDNSERERYQDGYDFLKTRGFRRLDFFGPGPIAFHPWMTSVFYRDNNCLSI